MAGISKKVLLRCGSIYTFNISSFICNNYYGCEADMNRIIMYFNLPRRTYIFPEFSIVLNLLPTSDKKDLLYPTHGCLELYIT